MTWLLINIAKFIFMTTNEGVLEIPTSVRDVDQCTEYFLKIKPQLYQSFVHFWTGHERFTRKCDKNLCSKVFIVDGHQKANRLVCQYKNVFDCTISEIGPVQMGCLYSPLRKGLFKTFQQHIFEPETRILYGVCNSKSTNQVFDLATCALFQSCL